MSSVSFVVVENRQNETLAACRRAADLAGENLVVLSSTEGGDRFAELVRRYVHLSSNPPEFELICFRRHFLLREYLVATPSCARFVLIDSDVLLFKGVGSYFEELGATSSFAGSSIAPNGWNPSQISPHVSFWTRQSLADFTDFIIRTYSSDAGLASLRAINDEFLAAGRRGGVSDMTLLYLWAVSSGHTRSCNEITASGAVDHNINIPHNHTEYEYKMRGGMKKLTYFKGQPYFTTVTGRKVKALALHFQGKSKVMMKHALQGRLLLVIFMSHALLFGRTAKNLIFAIRRPSPRLPL